MRPFSRGVTGKMSTQQGLYLIHSGINNNYRLDVSVLYIYLPRLSRLNKQSKN